MRLWFVATTFVVIASAGPTAEGPKPFVRGSWQQLLIAHAGRPLVVHLWGVTCAPCVTELPKWGRLVSERPGVDVVFVAADPVLEDRTAVTARLEQAGLLRAENWIFADRFIDRLRFEIDPGWEGELPVTLLITQDRQTTVKTGIVDFALIRDWIRKQLHQTGSTSD